MIAEIDRGLALIDQRFTELAANGDERANRFLESLTRARTELDTLAAQASTQDDAIGSLAGADRRHCARASSGSPAKFATASGSRSAKRRAAPTGWPKPPRRPGRRSAGCATRPSKPASGCRQRAPRSSSSASGSRRCWRASTAGSKTRSRSSPSSPRRWSRSSAKRPDLSAETGPALIASLVQVKEAAAHAAERAREAIEAVIPETAGKLSEEAAQALERVIRESVEDRLRDVETVAARAVEFGPRGVGPADPAR